MKWETILISKELTIDMGILDEEYIVRIFLDRAKPDPMTWKPTYGRVIEKRFTKNETPKLLQMLIDTIPEDYYKTLEAHTERNKLLYE